MKYNIILRNGNYALLEAQTQYIVACGFDETQPENQQWDHGLYYSHYNTSETEKQKMLFAALETFRTRTEPNYIPRYRLEELATQFKDAIIADTIAIDGDGQGAIYFFDNECEMTDEEKEFFGIETENNEYMPSSENGDYSPSNPWDAPGMSIRDFI